MEVPQLPSFAFDNLFSLRQTMLDHERAQQALLQGIHPIHQDSARNLLHYLSLRTVNLREIQAQLSELGLSSLGHSEGYTLSNLEQVLRLLALLEGRAFVPSMHLPQNASSYALAKSSLQQHKRLLFGPSHRSNHCRIMVTLPSEAASDPTLIRSLLEAGMDLVRINCSHDEEGAWLRMIEHVREQSAALRRSCPIYMDLAGPKLRTGPIRSNLVSHSGKALDYLLLRMGDFLTLQDPIAEGNQPDDVHNEERDQAIPSVTVTLPGLPGAVEIGHRIWFDDGKIGAIVTEKSPKRLLLRVTQAALQGSKLKAEKGINLPDSDLPLASLMPDDLAAMPFVATHADIVGHSFVRSASDVAALQAQLLRYGRPEMGMVLKVETRSAFDQFPHLLLQAMQSPHIGVMIARGDLAVEVGWERSSEVQEELLWLCEAAHIPAIWATQVLEKLAKEGVATRAEITDAAMSARAECVMLNKGPYITHAVRTLDNIISRMESHQEKKKGMLRPLQVAQGYWRSVEG